MNIIESKLFVFRKEYLHILIKDKVSVFIAFWIKDSVVFVAIVFQILKNI